MRMPVHNDPDSNDDAKQNHTRGVRRWNVAALTGTHATIVRAAGCVGPRESIFVVVVSLCSERSLMSKLVRTTLLFGRTCGATPAKTTSSTTGVWSTDLATPTPQDELPQKRAVPVAGAM